MSFHYQKLTFVEEITDINLIKRRGGSSITMKMKFVKQVSWIEALFYKTQRYKRIKYSCEECGNVFLGFVKSTKEELEYPHCYSE